MKKGFTLVELIITVSLIVLIGLVAIPRVRNLITDSKQKAYDSMVDTIEDAAKSYTYLNSSTIDATITANGYAEVTILTLQQNGLLKTELVNPLTNSNVSASVVVKITKNSNLYSFEYMGG